MLGIVVAWLAQKALWLKHLKISWLAVLKPIGNNTRKLKAQNTVLADLNPIAGDVITRAKEKIIPHFFVIDKQK